MPHAVVSDGIEVAVRMLLGDDNDVLNIFHCTAAVDGPYSAADLLGVATGFFTTFADTFLTIMSNQITLESATAKDLSTLLGTSATYVPGTAPVGSESAASTPANVALVTSWKEGISYRGGHPRTYLAGIPVDVFSDPQHVSGSYRNTVQTAANAFIAGIDALTGAGSIYPLIFAVVHYSLHGTVQTPPITEAITAAVVNTRSDSQRRRLGA